LIFPTYGAAEEYVVGGIWLAPNDEIGGIRHGGSTGCIPSGAVKRGGKGSDEPVPALRDWGYEDRIRPRLVVPVVVDGNDVGKGVVAGATCAERFRDRWERDFPLDNIDDCWEIGGRFGWEGLGGRPAVAGGIGDSTVCSDENHVEVYCAN
jgi:hypothetical protein